jgi:protein gp37
MEAMVELNEFNGNRHLLRCACIRQRVRVHACALMASARGAIDQQIAAAVVANVAHHYGCEGFAPAGSKADPMPQSGSSCEVLRDKWAKKAREMCVRPRVFCASLADWLDNQVPQQWRVDLGQVIIETSELDWPLLTKRIENFKKLAPWVQCPPNVWLGETTENQEYFDQRWPILARIPASCISFPMSQRLDH